MKRVEARAPVRLDLAGGWTDVPPYTHDVGGEVVNVAINIHAHASLEIDDEGHLSVNYRCDAPVGSGLGTTGAINVADLLNKRQFKTRSIIFENMPAVNFL